MKKKDDNWISILILDTLVLKRHLNEASLYAAHFLFDPSHCYLPTLHAHFNVVISMVNPPLSLHNDRLFDKDNQRSTAL